MGSETEYVVWTIFLRNLQKLYNFYQEMSTSGTNEPVSTYENFKVIHCKSFGAFISQIFCFNLDIFGNSSGTSFGENWG